MDFGALDLRHLRLVRAVVEEGSLTAAAARLALSQPALSHQLVGVEGRLGVDLFERRGRSLVLTEAGARVLASAGVVLAEVERAEADLAALAAGLAGTLRVATECFTTYHWLPDVVAELRRGYPGVAVELAASVSERLGEALAARAIDVGLVTLVDGLPDGLALTPLFDDEVVAVVPEGHPWSERPFVAAADFASEHLFVYESGVGRDPVLAGVLAPAGVQPRKVTAVPGSTEAVVGMVRAGLGVATMARWAATPYLERGGLAALGVTEGGVSRTWLAAVRDEARPAYVDAFVAALETVGVFDGDACLPPHRRPSTTGKAKTAGA